MSGPVTGNRAPDKVSRQVRPWLSRVAFVHAPNILVARCLEKWIVLRCAASPAFLALLRKILPWQKEAPTSLEAQSVASVTAVCQALRTLSTFLEHIRAQLSASGCQIASTTSHAGSPAWKLTAALQMPQLASHCIFLLPRFLCLLKVVFILLT